MSALAHQRVTRDRGPAFVVQAEARGDISGSPELIETCRSSKNQRDDDLQVVEA